MMSQIILNGLSKDEFKEIIFQCLLEAIDLKKPEYQSKVKTEDEYLTRNEVTKLLKISLPTLHDWSKRGIVISHKIGKRVLYKLDEIKEAITERNFIKFKRGGLNA